MFTDALPGSSKISSTHWVAQHGYWTRAWITQELILACHITIVANNTELFIEDVPRVVMVVDSYGVKDRKPKLVSIWPECFLGDSRGLEFAKGQSLPYLLSVSRHKQCAVPRDRVFSLLSLYEEGSDIPVDYEMALEHLARSIITRCRNLFCLCSMATVTDALGLDPRGNDTKLKTLPDGRFAYLELAARAADLQKYILVRGTFAQLGIPSSMRLNGTVSPR